MTRRLVVLLFFGAPFAGAFLGVGCKKTAPGASDAPVASSSVSASGSASAAGPAGPSSVEQAWVDAREGDPLELQRLADRVGVDLLVEVAEGEQRSAEDRKSAIAALAYVDDPTPALVPLTRLAASGSDERAELALDALLAVAPVRSLGEESDPTAWRVCGEDLVAALPILPSARLPKAQLVLRMLEGRGAIDAKSL